MTRAVDFALDDHAVTAVAVVTGDEQRQQAGDEEENAVPGTVSVWSGRPNWHRLT